MVKRKDDATLQEEVLASQIPEFTETPQEEVRVPEKISSRILNRNQVDEEEIADFEKRTNTTGLGENIFAKAEARDGWIAIDRRLLGERDFYYPEDWQFMVRPATVEVVRNWSMLDETNGNSIDDVFNEVMKSCISIQTPNGPLPWGNINSWDRFFFLLLVREYTFIQGETAIKYDEDCIECENPITFQLTSQSLMYEYPDEEVMNMYEPNTRSWHIDPAEYEVNEDPITLYLPTIRCCLCLLIEFAEIFVPRLSTKIMHVFLPVS